MCLAEESLRNSLRLKETLPPEKRTPSSVRHSIRTMGAILFTTCFIGSIAFFKLTKKEEQIEQTVRVNTGANGLPFYFDYDHSML